MSQTSTSFDRRPLLALTIIFIAGALFAPSKELLLAWYSGTGYEQFTLVGANSPSSVVWVLFVWFGVRAGYGIASAFILFGLWCRLTRKAEPDTGNRYLIRGSLLGAALYLTPLLLSHMVF